MWSLACFFWGRTFFTFFLKKVVKVYFWLQHVCIIIGSAFKRKQDFTLFTDVSFSRKRPFPCSVGLVYFYVGKERQPAGQQRFRGPDGTGFQCQDWQHQRVASWPIWRSSRVFTKATKGKWESLAGILTYWIHMIFWFILKVSTRNVWLTCWMHQY